MRFFILILSVLFKSSMALALCNLPSPDVAVQKILYNTDNRQVVEICSPADGKCPIDSAKTEYIYIFRDWENPKKYKGRAFVLASSPLGKSIGNGRANYVSCHKLSDDKISQALASPAGERVRTFDKLTRGLRKITPNKIIVVQVVGSPETKSHFVQELRTMTSQLYPKLSQKQLPRLSQDPKNLSN